MKWVGAALVVAAVMASPQRSPAASTAHYVVPVAGAQYARTHHDYPAADIFSPAGCGADVVAPTSGLVTQVRRIDLWRQSRDNPAYRGGKTITLVGDDGVRYYLAHLASVERSIIAGKRVGAGRLLGTVGRTGRAGSCHLHLGISPACSEREWQVRRGVVWPQRYLDAWRKGVDTNPASEIAAWAATNSGACSAAGASPHAGDA